MDRQSERELIRAAVNDDRAAAARLIEYHQRSVYAYILRMCGRPETAEDVVQEAFVRVLMNLHKFDERFRFSTWLFTIARRVYLNQAQKMKPVFDSDTVGAAGGPAPESQTFAERDERAEVAKSSLARGLACLGDEQREAVVLFHQQNWSIAVIAQHMGLPEVTVKSHLHRGRRKLREAIVALESGSPARLEALGVPGSEHDTTDRSGPAQNAKSERSTAVNGQGPAGESAGADDIRVESRDVALPPAFNPRLRPEGGLA
ncbi:MAG: RNA polymerase sigma factor [Planctomycetota bacterium]